MLHECRVHMLSRLALATFVLALASCSKPQTPVQIHEPSSEKSARVETPVVGQDKPEAAVSEGADPAQFAQIVNHKNKTFVVLSAEPDHEHWANGDAILVSKDSPVVTRKDVDVSLLPKTMTRVVGRSMRLVGASGEVCRGTLAKPFLLSRVEPHFGERARWNGEEEDENGNKMPALSDERLAEVAWDMTTDGKLLVSELVETTGDCRDARFARAADLPALSTVSARSPAAGLTTQALAAFRKMPAWETIETSYQGTKDAQPSVSWTESQSADVTIREFSTGKASYVWVSAYAGETCSEFSGRLSVLWKVKGTNAKKYEFEVLYEGDAEFSPNMLVELPGDSGPSLLGQESMLRKDPKVYGVEELHVPFLDCPC